MKGLLLKDFYMMRKYCRSFLLVCAIFLAVAFINEDNAYFLLYISVFTSILPVTLLSYDERFKWDQYADTFPLSRAQAVTEKYIVALICGCTGALLSTAAAVFSASRAGTPFGISAAEISTFWIISLLTPSILLPVIFRYGVEKGRIVYYIVIGAGCAAALILSDRLNVSSTVGINAGVFAAVAAVLLIFLLSWRLSVAFYNKRQL